MNTAKDGGATADGGDAEEISHEGEAVQPGVDTESPEWNAAYAEGAAGAAAPNIDGAQQAVGVNASGEFPISFVLKGVTYTMYVKKFDNTVAETASSLSSADQSAILRKRSIEVTKQLRRATARPHPTPAFPLPGVLVPSQPLASLCIRKDERRGISSDLGPSSNRDDLYLQSLRDTNEPSLIEIADYISGSLSQRKVKGKREKDPAAVAASALKRKRASKGDAAAAGEGWEGAHDAGYWGAAPGGEAYNPEEADAATAAAAIAMASIDGGAAGGIAPLGAPGARKAAKREIPAGRGRGVRHPPLQAGAAQHPGARQALGAGGKPSKAVRGAAAQQPADEVALECDMETSEVGRLLAQKESLRGFQRTFFEEKITQAALLRAWEPEDYQQYVPGMTRALGHNLKKLVLEYLDGQQEGSQGAAAGAGGASGPNGEHARTELGRFLASRGLSRLQLAFFGEGLRHVSDCEEWNQEEFAALVPGMSSALAFCAATAFAEARGGGDPAAAPIIGGEEEEEPQETA